MNPTSRLIAIGLVLAVSLYFLWPTVRFYQLDSERAPLFDKVRSGKATAADSMALARWDSVHADSYRSAKAGRLKLGLDLRGGVYITMEIDAPTLLLENAQPDAVDETFEKVIDDTRKEAVTSDEPVIDIFARNFDRLARPQGKTLLNYYDVGSLGDDASDNAIIKKLSKNIEDAVDQAIEVVRRRIDQFGVSEVSITRQAGRRIIIELPGVSDENEVRSLLQTTARLEFKLLKNDVNTAKAFRRIDALLAGKVATGDTSAKVDTAKSQTPKDTGVVTGDTTKRGDSGSASGKDTGTSKQTAGNQTDTSKQSAGGDTAGKAPVAKSDSSDTTNPYAGLPQEEVAKRYRADHPFTTLFLSRVSMKEGENPQEFAYITDNLPAGEYHFHITRKGMQELHKLLARNDVRGAMPEDVVLAISAEPEFPDPTNPDNNLYGLYAVTREPELTGEVITDAYPSFDESGRPMVLMQMSADGADRWAQITGKNIKKRVAIVLDSAVYSAPTVQNKITGGNSQITGSKDAKEANLLAVVLKAGALKAPIKIIEERVVGPSLGEDSIREGVMATLIGAALVMLFMIIYYSAGGIIADIAVMFNVLITLAVLAAFGASLTLPGIGGLVLTIGMAVDGNILIYERIREELARGRSLKSAVQLGYEKAFAAIIDTHITTFMTGAILYFFGSGPIQGFAVTLMIGIAATLFTAVFCTRTVFLFLLDRGAIRFNFGQPEKPQLAKA